MIKKFIASKEFHLNICQLFFGKQTSHMMYIYAFCRSRAVCWKNARFSIIPSGAYKQVSRCGIVKLKKQKSKCCIYLNKSSMKIIAFFTFTAFG